MEPRIPRPPRVSLRMARQIFQVKSEFVARRLGLSLRTLMRKELKPLQQQTVRSVAEYAQAVGGHLEMWIVMPDGRGVELDVDRVG